MRPPTVDGRSTRLRREIEDEFRPSARLASRLFGPLLLWTSRREEKRLARGQTYEPRTFIERANWDND